MAFHFGSDWSSREFMDNTPPFPDDLAAADGLVIIFSQLTRNFLIIEHESRLQLKQGML